MYSPSPLGGLFSLRTVSKRLRFIFLETPDGIGHQHRAIVVEMATDRATTTLRANPVDRVSNRLENTCDNGSETTLHF